VATPPDLEHLVHRFVVTGPGEDDPIDVPSCCIESNGEDRTRVQQRDRCLDRDQTGYVMEPNDLAVQLGVTPKSLRAWLRRTYPRTDVDHNARWHLTETQVAAARAHFRGGQSPPASQRLPATRRTARSREASDEAYVIDLCDEILGEQSQRQYRFDWLLGDPGATGGRVGLPVDAYYPDHGLVVEYRERQHDELVAHFDKPDRMTIGGVHRGEQRQLYDRRREDQIPAHGLRLIVIRADDLASDTRRRLRRDRETDLRSLRQLLG
jgi:hypothetical protein